jgi:hypothetical protein
MRPSFTKGGPNPSRRHLRSALLETAMRLLVCRSVKYCAFVAFGVLLKCIARQYAILPTNNSGEKRGPFFPGGSIQSECRNASCSRKRSARGASNSAGTGKLRYFSKVDLSRATDLRSASMQCLSCSLFSQSQKSAASCRQVRSLCRVFASRAARAKRRLAGLRPG